MIKNSVYGIYFARCMNIFNSLLAQLVKYDVHTTRKINSIHAIFYHILSLSNVRYRYRSDTTRGQHVARPMINFSSLRVSQPFDQHEVILLAHKGTQV